PIRVPRCDAPISMGAPSTAIFLRSDFKMSITTRPSEMIDQPSGINVREKTEQGRSFPVQLHLTLSRLFGEPCHPRGTKLSQPHSLREAVTRRSKRRLSRIAKGR